MLKRLREDRQRLLTRARRWAALQEIEDQFHLCLSEEEVFRAATLFLSLLSEDSLIDKHAVAQRMRDELAMTQGE